MKHFKHLNLYEREEISRCLALNMSYRQISRLLKRSTSTILREINKCSQNRLDYRAIDAHRITKRFKQTARKKRKLEENDKLRKIVIKYFKLRWSPEQIAKRLKYLYPDDMTMHISHESIYSYIYIHPRNNLKRELVNHLRRKHIFRRSKNKERKKSYPIQDYISIDDRPTEANDRKIAGHWEGDLIMGSRNLSAIGTLVERKTRMTFIVKLKNKDAASVSQAYACKLNRLPEYLKKSLTYDHGCEMAKHKDFTQKTKMKVYFAHPHSPWERETSENTNALIRDFYPKGTDFSKISSRQLKKVENLLNDRPRKTLNFYTPREVFTKSVAFET